MPRANITSPSQVRIPVANRIKSSHNNSIADFMRISNSMIHIGVKACSV